MSNPNINLKNINYDSIYNELVTYIKGQSDFADFDFEGSALATIIDLLTYNTFYQVLFQNILVNEMFLDTSQKLESVISHAKIHGYTVSPRTSSKANITISNNISIGNTVPAFTRFQGRKTNGEIKIFYNITSQVVSNNSGAVNVTFDIYEASQAVQNAIFENTGTSTAINLQNQSIFVPEKNIDTNTLKVEVQVSPTSSFEEYTLSGSILPNVSTDDKFYYLERKGSGYKLVFGSFIDELTGKVSPNKLTDNSKVRVSYLVSSGESGNGCSSFSFVSAPAGFANSSISTNGGLSKGGSDEPNIETLKSFVPRFFAAQERVVTKDDIKVLLVNNISSAETLDDITIETKDENSSIPLGEVYFRIDGVAAGSSDATTAETLVNNKGMVGIDYKYGTFTSTAAVSGGTGSTGGTVTGSTGGTGDSEDASISTSSSSSSTGSGSGGSGY